MKLKLPNSWRIREGSDCLRKGEERKTGRQASKRANEFGVEQANGERSQEVLLYILLYYVLMIV